MKEGTHKPSQKRYAVKIIDKKYVDKDDLVLLTREIDIMKQVAHKNVRSSTQKTSLILFVGSIIARDL